MGYFDDGVLNISMVALEATTVHTTSDADIDGNLNVDGAAQVDGVVTAGSAAGSNTAPNVALGGDANTGPYLVAADWAAMTAGGVAHMQWQGSESRSLVAFAAATSFALAGIISPAQITGDVNDYAPTGIGTCGILRVDLDADHNMTGLGGGGTGRVLILMNISTHALTLKNNSGSSAVGDKFRLSGATDKVVAQGATAILVYDATSLVWTAL